MIGILVAAGPSFPLGYNTRRFSNAFTSLRLALVSPSAIMKSRKSPVRVSLRLALVSPSAIILRGRGAWLDEVAAGPCFPIGYNNAQKAAMHRRQLRLALVSPSAIISTPPYHPF